MTEQAVSATPLFTVISSPLQRANPRFLISVRTLDRGFEKLPMQINCRMFGRTKIKRLVQPIVNERGILVFKRHCQIKLLVMVILEDLDLFDFLRSKLKWDRKDQFRLTRIFVREANSLFCY
ncbi:MAG: hypothetical protein ACFE8U_10135 [Candidatus Hermodarchaeota archaeon]